jgi:anti-sigma factor RsiW
MADADPRDSPMTTMRGAGSPGAAGRDLDCVELVELVTEYLEGALTPAERARVDAHLADCDGCTSYVEQVRMTIVAAGHLAPDDLPPGVMDRLLAAFRER